MSKIWVYVDQFKGQALAASWEALGAGLSLAAQSADGVTALVFGKGVEAIAQEAFQYGASEVLLADDATLDDYRSEPYATLVARLAGESKPDVILFPTTTRGREAAAMAAIDLNTGVLVDVTLWNSKMAKSGGASGVCWEITGGSDVTGITTDYHTARAGIRQASLTTWTQR
jgi:electron transfer flavoprotein alpha subunit